MSNRNSRKIPAKTTRHQTKRAVQASRLSVFPLPSWLPTDSSDFIAWGQAAERACQEFKAAYRGPQSRLSEEKGREEIEKARQLFWYTLERAYPAGFWEGLSALQAGDTVDLEIYLRFLEADGYFFRSGYAKAEINRHLKRIPLTLSQQRRLQVIILAVVDKGWRREFRSFCRVARHIQSPEWLKEIEQRVASPDRQLSLRARWVLEACHQR